MIIYYKELNGEPSTYEPFTIGEEDKKNTYKHILNLLNDINFEFINFYVKENKQVFLNKNFILQVEIND